MSSVKSLSLVNSIEFLIRIEKGPDTGKVYRIYPPKIEIGRDPSLQIVVTDPKASRKQCSIIIKDDVLLKDDSSRGTTLVNGQKFSEHALKPGDLISFGETEIQFLAKSLEQKKAKPQLTGSSRSNKQPASQEKQQARKKFQFFLIIIAILAGALSLIEEEVPVVEEQLITKEQLDKQIEDSEQKQFDIKETARAQRKIKKRRYLLSVEQHFIKGRRDLQAGQYGRAMDSFGTTIATDNNHQEAQYYSKVARKKRSDLIDTHLRDGIKYKEKLMFDRCAAELQKAIVLINNKNTQKYRIAKTQLEECRVLKSGGF